MERDAAESDGFAKNILFPAFADAGANEAFSSTKLREPADKIVESKISMESSQDEPFNSLSIRKVPSTSSHDSVASAGAPTEVQNNLSKKTNVMKVMRSAPGLPKSTSGTKSRSLPPPVSTARSAPSFFATTRPQVTKSLSMGGDAPQPGNDGKLVIESPPRLPRRAMPAQRSSSTVALAGASLFSSDSSVPDESGDEATADEDANEAIEHKRVDSPRWEEEATPAETAFGKELLFRRELSPNSSDRFSTASEMGTVIGPSQLEALDADVEQAALAIENFQSPATPPGEPSGQDGQKSVRLKWEEKGLSLPVLEPPEVDDGTRSSKKDPQPKQTSFARAFGPGAVDQEISPGRRYRTSASAPSTPMQSSLSPSIKPSSPPSNPTPSSFLLRSPGSSAHFAANSRRYFLSPRQRYDPEHQKVERIPEEGTPQERKARGGGLPFQIARSCFSFDAYDTAIDKQVEYKLDSQTAFKLGTEKFLLENPQLPIRRQDYPSPKERPGVRSSASWDISTQSLFRPTGFSQTQKRDQGIAYSQSVDAYQDRGSRVRIMSDYSPPVNPNTSLQLVSPQRVSSHDKKQADIEREDAIDLLASLVERGVAFSIPAEDEDIEVRIRETKEGMQSLESSLGSGELLDKLAKSHEFALEMKSASDSASTWLKSIGRSLSETKTDDNASRARIEDMNQISEKQLVNSLETELQEKTELAERLNAELAKCRAEIGRLRSKPSSTGFTSPNQSILDQSDDVSVSENQESTDDENHVDLTDDYLNNPIVDRSVESPSFGGSNSELARYKAALAEANQRIEVLYSDLRSDSKDEDEMEEAAPIVKVQSVMSSPKNPQSPSNQEEQMINVRMLDGENFVTEWDDLIPPLPPPPDHGLRSPIVAAVLNEWSEDSALHESLINWIDSVLAGMDPTSIPPLTISSLDHQVRDAFTMHVLPLLLRRHDIRVDVKTRAQRRTAYDLAVAVEGTVPERTPVQLDAFRHLETTAARSEVGNASIAHSTATTAVMANISEPPRSLTSALGLHGRQSPEAREFGTSRLSYDEMAEGMSSNQNSTLMSTLGGALGGLLARRRPSTAGQILPSPSAEAPNDTSSPSTVPDSDTKSSSSSAEEDLEGTEPYHRVVSAPPGRIGVTFVEYRGHAMVSDVAQDSPLQGWIFPSDILIAIDELAVSGMRIREIIQILKDRNQQQRALRVISIQSMGDAVLSTTAVNESTSEVIQ